MAADQKTAKKKMPNRRLKKTVRRSIAGVLMASALLVAAIPARETTARITSEEASHTVSSLGSSNGRTISYLDGIGQSALDAQVSSAEVAGDANLSELIFHTGRLGSNDVLADMTSYIINGTRFDWQFKFFTKVFGGNSPLAVIYQYNNNDDVESVNIPTELVTGYTVINAADYANFQKLIGDQLYDEGGIRVVSQELVPANDPKVYMNLSKLASKDDITNADNAESWINYYYNDTASDENGLAWGIFNEYEQGVTRKNDFITRAREYAQGYLDKKQEKTNADNQVSQLLSALNTKWSITVTATDESAVSAKRKELSDAIDALDTLNPDYDTKKNELTAQQNEFNNEVLAYESAKTTAEGLAQELSEYPEPSTIKSDPAAIGSFIKNQDDLYMLFLDAAFRGAIRMAESDVQSSLDELASAGLNRNWKKATVAKITRPTDTGWEDAYAVKAVDTGYSAFTDKLDENGYYCSGKFPVYAIGGYYAEVPGGKIVASGSSGGNIVGAFQGVKEVRNVTMEYDADGTHFGVQKIGAYAFDSSDMLESVQMSGCTIVGPKSFSGCTSLTSVVLGRGTGSIGTEAFKNCTNLRNCSMDGSEGLVVPPNVYKVGVGAFSGCSSLGSVDFSQLAVTCDIYDYAFFDCKNLSSVNFSTDRINSIGNAVLALTSMGGEGLKSISLPEIKSGPYSYQDFADQKQQREGSDPVIPKCYGDYLLFNRSYLEEVHIDGNYSGDSDSSPCYLYDNMLGNCSNLHVLSFGTDKAQCSYCLFNGDNLFNEVTYEDFYVTGPLNAANNASAMAGPRRSTLGSLWGGYLINYEYVPYRYTQGGKDYFETQVGDYYITVEADTGTVTSCLIADSAENPEKLEIPSSVGGVTVTGLASDCFDKDRGVTPRVRDTVKELIIADDSLSEIGSGVFANFSVLEKATIGNSVRVIGDNVFSNCPKLVDIEFTHNEEEGKQLEMSEDNVFLTGSNYLTIHGPISEAFGPYLYAINENNYVSAKGSTNRVRICYQSNSPNYLTVIRDNKTNLVTLVDYPKFSLLDADHAAYCAEMKDKYYASCQGSAYDDERMSYASALIDYATKLKLGDTTASWDSVDAANGPWVNANWLGGSEQEGQLYNNDSTKINLVNPDYLVYFYNNGYQQLKNAGLIADAKDAAPVFPNPFAPLKVYAASSTELADILDQDISVANSVQTWYIELLKGYVNPSYDNQTVTTSKGMAIPYFNDLKVGDTEYNHTYSIIRNDQEKNDVHTEGMPIQNERERTWVEACRVIDIPYGVDSIDVKDYFTNGGNAPEISAYFNHKSASGKSVVSPEEYFMYTGQDPYSSDVVLDSIGAHPGLFSGYYVDENSGENKVIGNDFIEKITLNGVKSLPEYCFESCEKLAEANLGSSLTEVGDMPFKGCDSMWTITPTYPAESRFFGANGILYENADSGLEIVECLGARGSGTDHGSRIISPADETDGTFLESLTGIRNGAFSDCDDIVSVDFSESPMVTTIPEDCFKDADKIQSVILSDSVTKIEDGAFAGETDDGQPISVTVTIPAKNVNIDDDAFNHDWVSFIKGPTDSAAKTYADRHEVNYSQQNMYTILFLNDDGNIFERRVVEEGYVLTEKFPANPTKTGYTFNGWKLIQGVDYRPVTSDLTFIATYTANPSPESGGGGGRITGSGSSKSSGSKNNNNNDNNSRSKYRVIVEYGSGDGEYEKDATVSIYANDPPEGNVFDRWVVINGLSSLDNASNRFTTFKMPSHEVRVQATYKKDGSTSGGSRSSSVAGSSNGDRASTTRTSSRDTTGNGSGNGRTSVVVNSSGISNQDLANAVVHGSTDNFIVRITQDDATTGQVEEALRATYGSLENLLYYPMNIQLFNSDGTMQITDTAGLTVDITVPLPDALRTYGGNNKVAAIRAGSLETLAPRFTSISGVPCISFTASHFSPYVIWTDTANLSDGLMDANPKTGDIEPKWFLSGGLAALSLLLFFKKDRRGRKVTA